MISTIGMFDEKIKTTEITASFSTDFLETLLLLLFLKILDIL